jgi:aryl sulfotransferase
MGAIVSISKSPPGSDSDLLGKYSVGSIRTVASTSSASSISVSTMAATESVLAQDFASPTLSSGRIVEPRYASNGDVVPSTGRVPSFGGLRGVEGHQHVALEWAAKSPNLPVRTMDYKSHMLDSERWNEVVSRPGDVVVASSYRAGAGWAESIISHLLKKPCSGAELNTSAPSSTTTNVSSTASLPCPCIETRGGPPVHVLRQQLAAASPHDRVLKTHLPLDGLPFSAGTRYVVVGRDLRDVACSCVSQWKSGSASRCQHMNDSVTSDNVASCDDTVAVGPPMPSLSGVTARECFLDLLEPSSEGEAMGLCSYWHLYDTWFQYRHLPNVHFMHCNDLKNDFRSEVSKLASFLNVTLSSSELDQLQVYVSLSYLKSHAHDALCLNAACIHSDGRGSFSHVVSKGCWNGVLSKKDIQLYLDYGRRRLGDACFYWLLTGELV